MSWLSKALGLDKIRNQTGKDPIKPLGDILKSLSSQATSAAFDELIAVADVAAQGLKAGVLHEMAKLGVSNTDRAVIEEYIANELDTLHNKVNAKKLIILDRWF